MKKVIIILVAVLLATTGIVCYLWNEEPDEISDDEMYDILGIPKLDNNIVECFNYDIKKDNPLEEFDHIKDDYERRSAIREKYGSRYVNLDTLFVIPPKLVDSLVSIEFDGNLNGDHYGTCTAKDSLIKELASVSKLTKVSWLTLRERNYTVYGYLISGERRELGGLVHEGKGGIEFRRKDLATCSEPKVVSSEFARIMFQKGNCSADSKNLYKL